MPDHNFAYDAAFDSPLGVHLMLHVRGDTIEEFRDRLAEAGGLFPGLILRGAQPAQQSATVTPAHTPATNSAGDPPCPVHRRPMKRSKFNGGEWYCTAKNRDGEYCRSTAEAPA